MSYLFAFSYCSWGSQGKNIEVVCNSVLQWTTFCQTSPPWPEHLGWPHMAWLSFIELDKAVVFVIRFASFQWLWFQSVCPLMPYLSAYCLTWVSLTLDVGYLFPSPSSKAQPLLLPWMCGSSSWPLLLCFSQLTCPDNSGRVPKMIVYGELCQILDIQRKKFSFRTRDQPWSLKSFCVAELY